MSETCSGFDPVDDLVEEYLERYRRGDRPSLSEYTDKYPDLADEIRELFPALVAIEQFGTGCDGATGPRSAQVEATRPMPERQGDYRIVREIARGGMGMVYEAIQESLGRHVALKVLPRHRLSDPNQLGRFRREARAAATLHHTHIVPVFGVGHQDGTHFYVMQLIQGQGLDAVLQELKKLRESRSGKPAGAVVAESQRAAAVIAKSLVSRRSHTVGLILHELANPILTSAAANIVAKTGRSEDEARAALAKVNPMQRLVTPEEVADTVLWLASSAASSINGQAVAVAGGEVLTG